MLGRAHSRVDHEQRWVRVSRVVYADDGSASGYCNRMYAPMYFQFNSEGESWEIDGTYTACKSSSRVRRSSSRKHHRKEVACDR